MALLSLLGGVTGLLDRRQYSPCWMVSAALLIRARKAARRLALPLAFAAVACTSDNSKTIYAYAPSIGAGSQPTLVPLQVPASTERANRVEQPINGYTFSEQVFTTDAELPQLADALIEALTPIGSGNPTAGTVFARLRDERGPALDGERFPSRLTRVVWSCNRPINGDGDRRLVAERYCRRPGDRYEEIQAASFTMWRTLDGIRCTECFLRHVSRRDQFLLGTLAAKLARVGYADHGSGEQQFTLGLPNPNGHVFARSGEGPMVVVSSGGIDPRTGGLPANTVVLTFFVYFPGKGT